MKEGKQCYVTEKLHLAEAQFWTDVAKLQLEQG